MRKTLPIPAGLLTLFLLGLFSLNHNNNIDNLKKRQSYFLKNSPINKNLRLSKKERLSKGLPPNKYFEREYLLEMNPALGRPTPEKLFELQKQLNSKKNTAQRVPGDNVSNLWEERGPNNIGGRTRAILFDPNDATHKRVFAGGVSGGLWVNSNIADPNSAWTRIGGISENVSVTSFTVDPNNTNNIFIATGETYTSGDVTGNGIWGSTDGGNTWSHVFGGKSGPTTITGSGTFLVSGEFNVNDIKAWNNGGSTVIFAAIGSNNFRFSGVNPTFIGTSKYGFYKSSDNGVTWLKVTSFNVPTTSYSYEVNDIEIAADNSIWVATRNTVYGDGGGKILHSIDGASFTAIDSISNGKRTQIAVSSTNAGTIYVLADVKTVDIIGNSIAPYLKILKTTDGFATAPTTLALPIDADTGIPANDFTRGQAFYDLMLEVDPNNDAIVYVGGIDSFRSADSGASWVQMTRWVDFGGLTIPIVHSDFHALVFHPTNSDIAVLGNDGGVYYASSLVGALTSTTAISSRNKNYNVTQFYKGAIGQSTSSDMFLGGTQDNGSPFINGASAGINSFTAIRGGDGAYEFIDKDGAYLITSYVYNTYDLYPLPYTGAGKITIQYDQGTGAFINPADLDHTLDILYADGYKAVTDTTSEIKQIARYTNITTTPVRTNLTDPLLTGRPTAFKVSPPYNIGSTTLYVGTDDGKLLKLAHANTTPTWTDITGSSFVGSVSAIAFGAIQNEIIVTFHNYGVTSVWFTTDGGTTWVDKEGDLPDLPVKAVMMNPLNNDEVIIGTDLGVWRTKYFKTAYPLWNQSQNGMQNSKVTSFDLRTADNTVLASTYGRGLFTGKFTPYTKDEFVTTWQTTRDNESITIPTTGSGYNYKVDWDIYNFSVAQTGNATHTYATAGIHTIKITGTFPRIYFKDSYVENKILTIEQWGTNAWTSMNYAFDGCTNLTDNTNDSPNLSNVTDMSYMFYNAAAFNGDLNNWDVSNVTNMKFLFYNATAFNGAINNWDVSRVYDMNSMFSNASAFNQDLSNWNVSNVTNMYGMFSGASVFNQNLNNWNVSNVTNMAYMFKTAWAFNGNINNWDVSSVTDMNNMFLGAKVFNGAIGSWNVSSVTDMSSMFMQATVFNGNISSWNVGAVTNMSRMFEFTTAFNQNLNNWNVISVTDMNYMFGSASAFNQDLSNWNVSSVLNMSYMFNDNQSFNGNINTWNVSSVTNMRYMFFDATNFNQDLNNWDVSNVTDMNYMFGAAFKGPPTFNGNISTWNVSNVLNMGAMFDGASAFNGNISSWNVSKVGDMGYMFRKASIFNGNISSWNVSKVWNMNSMFYNASVFDQDLGNWDISSVTNMNSILFGVKLSTPNYDNTLIGWSTLSTGEIKIPTSITFNGGNSFYCAGDMARTTLTSAPYNWTIYDGGKNCTNTSLWTGSTNTSWNNTGNWDNGIPTLSIYAAIPNVTNKPVINTAGMVCNSLNILPGSSLTLESGNGLTVNGNLTNNGTFTINSDVNTSGSLIVAGTSTGNITYNRYMTGGSDWHLIAAPVGGQDINNFATNVNNNVVLGGTGNVNYSLTPYDNTVAAGSGNWTHWTTDGSGLGLPPAVPFTPGKGYEILTTGGTVDFTGTVATSQVSIPITVPASSGNAWNLIGNPFPSSLFANTNADATNNFITVNNGSMDASFVGFYLWDPTLTTPAYIPINQATATTHIAPGQAFFVKSIAGGATINFTTAMRTNQSTVAFNKVSTPATPTITLKADNGSTIKTTDIKYIAGTTLGLDPGYDAGLIDATSSNFKLYTHLVEQDNGVDFMLQALPDNVYDTTVIPVGLDAVSGTQVTFTADITNLPLGKKVYLEDRLLGVFNELNNTDKSYNITLSADANGIGRFYLHTLDNLSTLAVNDFTKLNFSVIAEPKANSIRVIGNIEAPGKINIYDTLGRLIKSLNLKTANDQSINVPNMAAGIYMVKISSKNSQFSTKIAWY